MCEMCSVIEVSIRRSGELLLGSGRGSFEMEAMFKLGFE